MTAKKKFNFKAPLEVFAKSIVQPMMYLSVAGILLIVGIILTNKTICAVIPVLGSGPFQLVGAVVYQSLMFIINNLSILFCVGIAGAMAKKNKGHASLIALMSFFLFLQANNIVLNATGSLAEASGMLGLTGTGQSTVMFGLRFRVPSPPSPALLRNPATSASLFTACSTSCSFPPVCTTSSTPRSSSPMWAAPLRWVIRLSPAPIPSVLPRWR